MRLQSTSIVGAGRCFVSSSSLLRFPPARRISFLRGLLQRLRKPPIGSESKKKPNFSKFKYRLENWTRKLVMFRTPSHGQHMSVREVVDRICSPAARQKVARFPRSLLARWRSIMLPHVGFGGVSEGNTIKVCFSFEHMNNILTLMIIVL